MNAQTFIDNMNQQRGFLPLLTTAQEIETLRWLADNDALTDAEEARLLELIHCYAGE